MCPNVFTSPVNLNGSLQNESLFDQERVTRLQGMETALSEAFHEGPLARMALVAEKEIDNTWPFTTFDEQQWKNSPFFRKDIDFKGISNSSGLVSKQYSEDVAQHRDARIERENTMASMPPGFWSGTDRFVGSTIGFMMDPINAATAILAPEFIGTKAAAILESIGKFSLPIRFAIKAGIGAAEGTSIVAPQVGVQLATDRPIGMPIESASALSTLALAAGTGGLVRGLFGFKSPVTSEGHQESLATAAGQLASGKSVNVETMLNQSYHSARNNEFVNREDEKVSALYGEKISTLRNQINEKEQNLRQELEQQQKSPENIKAFSILSTLQEQRSESDIEFLKQYTEQGESTLIKNRIENEESQVKLLEKKPIIEKEDKEQIDSLKQSITLSKNRLSELVTKKPIDTKKVQMLYRKLDELESSQSAQTKMNQNPGEAPNLSDVIASSDHVNSYKGDSVYNEGKTKSFDAQIDNIPENVGSDWEEEKARYEEEVPEESRDEFDQEVESNIEKREVELKNYKNGLNAVLNCLRRNP